MAEHQTFWNSKQETLSAKGIVHPDIINPGPGEPLEIREGTRGELIYISIDRECMPLIRFRTRDHVVVTQTGCECGRTGFGIRCIGRTDDLLKLKQKTEALIREKLIFRAVVELVAPNS